MLLVSCSSPGAEKDYSFVYTCMAGFGDRHEFGLVLMNDFCSWQ